MLIQLVCSTDRQVEIINYHLQSNSDVTQQQNRETEQNLLSYLWRAVSAGRAVLSFSPAVMSWLMAGRPRWPSWNIPVVMITTSVERQGYNATVNPVPDWMTHLLEWTINVQYLMMKHFITINRILYSVTTRKYNLTMSHCVIVRNTSKINKSWTSCWPLEFMCLCIGWWLFAAKPWYRLNLTFGYDNIINFVIQIIRWK